MKRVEQERLRKGSRSTEKLRAQKLAEKSRRPRQKLRKGQDKAQKPTGGSEIHKQPRRGRAQKRPRRVGWVPKVQFLTKIMQGQGSSGNSSPLKYSFWCPLPETILGRCRRAHLNLKSGPVWCASVQLLRARISCAKTPQTLNSEGPRS